MRAVGQMYNEDAGKALVEAKLQGETIARELSSFGIDLCFAPVLDIDHGLSQIIGDRAFSDRGDVIVELARAVRARLNANGLAANGKHFPGHGAVPLDSHLDTPANRRPDNQTLAPEHGRA